MTGSMAKKRHGGTGGLKEAQKPVHLFHSFESFFSLFLQYLKNTGQKVFHMIIKYVGGTKFSQVL